MNAGQRFEDKLGDLLEEHDLRKDAAVTYPGYADDPVGFIEDVLGGEPWGKQREIARAVLEANLLTVRSCHAAGKDWLVARLALWWVYAREGKVVLTGPTADQVEEILMRSEIREAFAEELAGSLHVKALRVPNRTDMGIVAKTARSTSDLTGFHAERLLVGVTEAQGVDPEIWDAALNLATGDEDRIVAVGNPGDPAGRFYEAHRPSSPWTAVRIPAHESPNVREGEVVIPGVVTESWVERMRAIKGPGSDYVRKRVEAEFPDRAERGLVARSWLEAAAERRITDLPPDVLADVRDGEILGEPVLGVDPARFGPDETVVAFRLGPVLIQFVSWEQASATKTVRRVKDIAQKLERGIGPNTNGTLWEKGRTQGRPKLQGRIEMDVAGVGGPIADQLQSDGYAVHPFRGAEQAGDEDRFYNRRSEAYIRFADKLKNGTILLTTEHTKLFGDLLAVRREVGPKGRDKLEPKETVKKRLGRSPGWADAAVMAFSDPQPAGVSAPVVW